MMLNVGIVGAGEGGTSILNTLLSVSDIKVVGVCDRNESAPGIKIARENNIPVFDDFIELVNLEMEKIILEVTGIDKIRDTLLTEADERTRIVDSATVMLLFKIINSRERLIEELEAESVRMADMAGNLSSTIQETSATSKENSVGLNNTVNNLIDTANQNQLNINETNEIIKFINKVANQTKMLGFNAAIEANRAGAEGNGFRVVADEIRKLADETGESVQEITHFVNELTKSTEETISHIEEMQQQSQSFLDVQNKISSTLVNVSEEIGEISETLVNLSKK